MERVNWPVYLYEHCCSKTLKSNYWNIWSGQICLPLEKCQVNRRKWGETSYLSVLFKFWRRCLINDVNFTCSQWDQFVRARNLCLSVCWMQLGSFCVLFETWKQSVWDFLLNNRYSFFLSKLNLIFPFLFFTDWQNHERVSKCWI